MIDEDIAIENELRDVVRSFLTEKDAKAANREGFEKDGGGLPEFWPELAELGLLAVHLPEEYGGAGADFSHLVPVLDELGAAVAPGPFLSTVAVSALLARSGTPAVQRQWLEALGEGSLTAGIALEGKLQLTGGRATGDAGVVVGSAGAGLVLVVNGQDALLLDLNAAGVTVTPAPGADPGLDTALVVLADVELGEDAVLAGAGALATALFRLAASAHATGGARAIMDDALAYAATRRQFGAPIGSFQAVKHHFANMLIELETGAACVWDATRQITAGDDVEFQRAAAAAAATAIPAYIFNTRTAIQVFGGIGYSWEHDAHLYYRRAIALSALIDPLAASREVAATWSPSLSHGRSPKLPESIEERRAEIRDLVASVAAHPQHERQAALTRVGLAMPQLASPWGLEASPALQLLIGQEMERAGVQEPSYGVTRWCAGSLIQNGTQEQVDRWAERALDGTEVWCQLFSEPEAGSDAAAVKTRATRVEGGWTVTGQKTWTSNAHNSHFGLATVRTDPSVSKHAGITAMVIDMAAPGVTVRPLRQISGGSHFNEVWLEDVFVPDFQVVGELGDGWRIARSTFENERMSLGRGNLDGQDLEGEVVGILRSDARNEVHAAEVGRFLARRHAARSMNLRWAEKAVTLKAPGAEGNITKMLRGESLQSIAELEMAMLGSGLAAAVPGTPGATAVYRWLDFHRATIAGGTSEIVRTQIAERILGLPRDRRA